MSKFCDDGSTCVEWWALVCVEDPALSCWGTEDGG